MLCFSIDATESCRLAKFVNDAPRTQANCIAKAAYIVGKPTVLLFAASKITAGTELRYDYGGKDLPWRKVSFAIILFHFPPDYSAHSLASRLVLF